jgi:hypothetical protein
VIHSSLQKAFDHTRSHQPIEVEAQVDAHSRAGGISRMH